MQQKKIKIHLQEKKNNLFSDKKSDFMASQFKRHDTVKKKKKIRSWSVHGLRDATVYVIFNDFGFKQLLFFLQFKRSNC